jgi:RecA/RadA recombinase
VRKPKAEAKVIAPPRVDMLGVLRRISKGISTMRTIGDMEEVQYIPTIFTSFNRAVEIGGAPLGRVWVVHGQNSMGKSVLAVGFLESFNILEHSGFYYDAEWATDKAWLVEHLKVNTLCGYDTPMNIEQVIGDLDTMIAQMEEGKKERAPVCACGAEFKGKTMKCRQCGAEREMAIRQDHRLAVVIDTITKLVPKRQLKTFLDGVKKGDTKQARSMQAGTISNWMKDVVPKLGATHGTLILVNQERANMNATGPYDQDWDLPCGEAIKFDNSMRIRVSYAKPIKVRESLGKGKYVDHVIGMEHFASIYKSKVGAARGAFKFYTANGLGDCPRGFDHAREIISELKIRGGTLFGKIEEKDGEYIESTVDGQTIKVKGERELRRLIRDGMIDAYRKALNADIPRHMESMKIGDINEGSDEA